MTLEGSGSKNPEPGVLLESRLSESAGRAVVRVFVCVCVPVCACVCLCVCVCWLGPRGVGPCHRVELGHPALGAGVQALRVAAGAEEHVLLLLPPAELLLQCLATQIQRDDWSLKASTWKGWVRKARQSVIYTLAF